MLPLLVFLRVCVCVRVLTKNCTVIMFVVWVCVCVRHPQAKLADYHQIRVARKKQSTRLPKQDQEHGLCH